MARTLALQQGDQRDWGPLRSVDWNAEARNVLKGALKRQGMSYVLLRQGLSKMGIEETEANLRNKINRGTFSTAFFLQCFAVMGNASLWLGNMYEYQPPNIEF